MSSLRILPLGKGNAFTRTDFPTSFIICADDEVMLFDCPAPLRRILGDAEKRSGLPLDIDRIHHVFLSHLHADHSNGLEEIGYFKTHVLAQDPAMLFILEENMNPCWDHKLRASMGYGDRDRSLATFFNPVPVQIGKPQQFELKSGTVKFTTCRTIHSVPCYALLLEYKGAKVGFSADTEFTQELVDFLSPADVIIHDANNSPNHTMISELESLPVGLKEKIFITHLTDGYENRSQYLRIAEPGVLVDVG